ncbi:hypothetical protein LR48_Vigan06g058700 [Vigna angularis]|uniref:Uncharacterized protein n=1 Tax=Phaseolus angularis TaxID=3914 RepID=A0A0L9URE0_PHAAN|nr:hypothetical protein LR48_Vigan06g058700 [Vigna angularis]
MVIAEWRRSCQEFKEMILEYQNQKKESQGREKSLGRARRGVKEEFLHDNKKGKKEVKKGRVVGQDSLLDIKKAKKPSYGGENSTNWEKKRETDISEENRVDQGREGNVVTITSGSRASEAAVLSVDCFVGIRGQDRREENICEEEGKDKNCDGDIVVAAEQVIEAAAVRVGNVTNVSRENKSGEDRDGNIVTLASPSKAAKVAIFSGDSVVGRGVYVKTVKKGEDKGKKRECGGNIVTIMSGNRVKDAAVLSGGKFIQEFKILVSQTYKTLEDQWQGYFFAGLQSNIQKQLPQQEPQDWIRDMQIALEIGEGSTMKNHTLY